MEVIVTRWYVIWSNIWCCCSLSKVAVLSRITTTNRATVLLLVPTAYLTFLKQACVPFGPGKEVLVLSFGTGKKIFVRI